MRHGHCNCPEERNVKNNSYRSFVCFLTAQRDVIRCGHSPDPGPDFIVECTVNIGGYALVMSDEVIELMAIARLRTDLHAERT